ncbi:MAG: hypothetical protein IPO46_09635 [Chitinophagaceae bacterium]|jgi:hypothetical protein|nr:hypothetical protein [Chitinophagaceae bacterium]NMD28106.1 hypothetical protein [Bacteroidota bacterium]MBK8775804.1 hypothetical protein [Chitinophagaceae bacterium]MBK8930187.1 hypothetical protein [Chitinophagaceae bacterium]MBK8930225.1 hypothetical protein [Chitinophagaceae bacterium]
MAGQLKNFCRNKCTVNKQKVEIMIHSSIDNVKLEPQPNSEPQPIGSTSPPDIGNTNVIGSARVEIKSVKTKPHFYAALLNPMQEIAKEMGYNLIIHGSMSRDFDLIAVAWVDNPKKEIELVKELDRFLKGSYFNNEQDYLFSVLPGGRKSYVINLVRAEKWNGYQDAQYYLDVSFTPLMSGSADR